MYACDGSLLVTWISRSPMTDARRCIRYLRGGVGDAHSESGVPITQIRRYIRMADAITTPADSPSFPPFTANGNCVNLVTDMAIAKHSDEGVAFAAELAADEPRGASKPSIVVGLFKTHARRVQSFLSFRLRDSAEGEDAAQDVFLKLWRQERQRTLRDEATNYMYAATQSAIIDIERHRAYVGRDRLPDVDVDEVVPAQPGAEDALHWRNAFVRFVNSVKALPDT